MDNLSRACPSYDERNGFFMSKAYGKKVWLIPDGFLHSVSLNDQVSHEAVCVLNTSDRNAVVSLTLYFEDREPMTGFTA